MDFFQTSISQKAITNAIEVLRTGWLSEGKVVKRFEDALVNEFGIVNPVTLNSGTAALHMALVVAGVKSGDEVILPAQTFVATGIAILMQGATPVFSDIQDTTGNISPESIKKKITEKTKAIIPVHWGGYPCDMDQINFIAREKNLIVIEDAAHALGALYENRPTGSTSRFTAFSFQAIKLLTTGDGGALACLDKKDASRAEVLRWFGIDRVNSKPSVLGEREYDICEYGYKYHLNDLAAAVGLGNLETLHRQLVRRREIACRYRDALNKIAGLELLDYQNDRVSSSWLFTILVEKRKDFILSMKRQGVPTSVVHLRIDKNSIFGGITPGLTGQERFDRLQVSIPIHTGLSDDDVELVVKSVKGGW